MSKLIELPSGAWIDPTTIKAVRPMPTASTDEGGTHRARVCINYGEGYIECITCNDDDDALTQARYYGQLANDARP